MLKTTQQRRTPSSTLIAFEPRQVTLARHQNMKKSDSSQILQNGSIDETLKSSKKGKSKKKKSKSSSKTDVPAPLLRSIAAYLEHIGFSKTLAAFRAEASITDEDGDSKVIPLDLEMYYKYLEASKSDLKATINGTEELGLDNTLSAEKSITENDTEENKPEAPVESIKKKRKKSKESDAAVVEEHPIDNKKITNDAKEDNGKSTNEVVSELQIKSREKKKKSKRAADSLNEDAQEVDTEALGNQVDNSVSESQPDMSDKKPKKKKKTKLDSMLDEGNATAEVLLEETKDKTDGKKKKKKSKSTTTDETFEQGTKENTNAVGVEKKISKKRKRLTSEEQESQPEDDILPKEARKSNTEVLDDNKGNDQQQKGNQLLEVEEQAGKKRKTENSQVVGQIKGDLEDNDLVQNRIEGSAPQKSSKKQHGSAEPKTVNAFQRVKIEKVEFADDRLQDNSYWAKDGAEIGYGAKAQEVLGQVRGRDFRHEKTKKKRGSYRGGQIDMQSHSVKFKDSDDE